MRQSRVVRILATGVAVFAIAGLAAPADAGTINLDLNTYCTDSNSLPFGGSSPTGTTAAAPDAGAKQWNNLLIGCGSHGTQTYNLGLVDSNGNAAGAATFDILTQNWSFHSEFTSGYNPMLWDYADSGGGSQVVTFSALNAAHTYDVYVYSWWDWGTGGSSTTSILAAGGSLPAAKTATWGSDDATNSNTFTQGVNYVLFSGLTPTAAGIIQLGGTGTIYNGFQLVESVPTATFNSAAVPEPSTILLLAAGIPFVIRRLRRRT